jgi:hypothetical protein
MNPASFLICARSVLSDMKCRIRRRPCSMTKKQYSKWNVTVGTVKKIEGDDHFPVILDKH